MRCQGIREKFVGYLEGEARLTERICVDVHVAGCYPCREELEDLREFFAATRMAVAHPRPRNRFGLLMTEIAEAESPPIQPRMTPRWKVARIAAAAGVLLFMGTPTSLLCPFNHPAEVSVAAGVRLGEASPGQGLPGAATPLARMGDPAAGDPVCRSIHFPHSQSAPVPVP